MTWTSLRIRVPDAREAVIAAMFAAGAQGVHEDADALVTHVDETVDIAALVAAVRAECPAAEVTQAPLPDVDWSEQWKQGVGAHDLGALVVAPPWLADRFDPARTIVIEPEMAFGTGEHATTRGVIRLLPQFIHPGDRVADLGAGSAVLAIAAAMLGASRVAAIEMDHDAIANAESNVARNGVAHRVTVIEGDAAQLLPLVAPVRLVLANIISSVLVALLPVIEQALTPDGHAILSGILAAERDEMLDVLRRSGWRVLAEDAEDIWWSVAIARA